MKKPKVVSTPIRMDASMLARISEASRLTGLTQAEVMRLAIAAGLADLAKVGYDLGNLISNAAGQAHPPDEPAKKPPLAALKSPRKTHGSAM